MGQTGNQCLLCCSSFVPTSLVPTRIDLDPSRVVSSKTHVRLHLQRTVESGGRGYWWWCGDAETVVGRFGGTDVRS